MKKLMMTLILVPTLLAGCGADAHVSQTFDYPIGIASIEYYQ